jgi:hypothetical protein
VRTLLEDEREALRSPSEMKEVVAAVKRAEQVLEGVGDCLDDIPDAPEPAAVVVRVKNAAKAKSRRGKGRKDKEEESSREEEQEEDDEEEAVLKRSKTGDVEKGQGKKGNGRVSKRAKKKSKKVVEMEEVNSDEENDKQQEAEKVATNGRKRAGFDKLGDENEKSKARVLDGMIGKTSRPDVEDEPLESLVFFSIGNEKDGKRWVCPLLLRTLRMMKRTTTQCSCLKLRPLSGPRFKCWHLAI